MAQLNVEIPDELKRELILHCAAHGFKQKEVIAVILENYLKINK